ncbi:Uroporphyrinogen III decarboxylase [hydrothermal vent metagenome]|uniref:uroporphyrinogen decarboxylase n=1 Tax=hydrothermal vent metagenome TaxID=652676 RepID=A0A3B1DBT0_9ZZZZ
MTKAAAISPELYNSRLMKTIRREKTDTTPIWIMRQAGRYLPEYMAVRGGHNFLDFCKRPDLAAEVTLDAQRILGVDAAILFADLPTILEPMGFGLSYNPGPVISNPFREPDDLKRVRVMEDAEEMGFVYETVRLVRKDLPADIPLLGFAGAPFTLASYAIEGAGSKSYLNTKLLMYRHPEVWDELMQRLCTSIIGYLKAQIAAGCQAVQLFDSWAGCLSPQDYRQFASPYTQQIISEISKHAPVINFLTGNPALLPLLRESGGDVIGIDWRIDLAKAWDIVGNDVAVQGNLEPIVLFSEISYLKQRTQQVLDAAAGRAGHIFNLGHGVMPGMNPENVKALVEMVHEMGVK